MYRIPGLPCFVTIATKEKQQVFSNEHLAREFVTLLRAMCQQSEIPLYAYCIMPDHVHLLLSASQDRGIIEFIRDAKSRVTKIARQRGYQGTIWQRSFYDHFLRQDEDCRTVADYIIHNPVRSGMVTEWKEYPFCGSLVYDL